MRQTTAQSLGREGEQWFQHVLPSTWVFQRPNEDFGIDGTMPIASPNAISGLEFSVHIKSSRHRPKKDGILTISGIPARGWPIAITGKVRRPQQARGHARREHLPIPSPVIEQHPARATATQSPPDRPVDSGCRRARRRGHLSWNLQESPALEFEALSYTVLDWLLFVQGAPSTVRWNVRMISHPVQPSGDGRTGQRMTGGMPVFISYAREDWSFAELLELRLSTKGFDPRRDKSALHGGVAWDPTLNTAIRHSHLLIVVVSKRSLESYYVLHECMIAMIAGVPIIPILIEPIDTKQMPRYLTQLHIIDFSVDSMDKWSSLFSALDKDIQLHRINEEIAPSYKLLGVAEDLHQFIVDFIRGPEDLVVVTDFVGYGHYTNPDLALEYRANLTEVRRPQKVKLACYSFDNDEPATGTRPQSRAIREYERLFETFDDDILTSAYREYYSKHAIYIQSFRSEAISIQIGGSPKGVDPEPPVAAVVPAADKDSFINDVCCVEKVFRQQLRKQGIQLREVKEKLNFFLWLKPDSAIFSLPELGDVSKEFIFWTVDRTLVGALHQMADKYFKTPR